MKDIDFNKIKGIAFDVDGVLSPSTIPLHPSGEPMRMVNVKDGYAIQLAVKKGLPMAIITGCTIQAVRMRYEGLGMTDVYLGASLKMPILEQWLEKHGLNSDEVAFVGDDVPDLPCMHAVGFPMAPRDACPEVLEIAKHISPFDGGQGVARDVIERVLKARGEWINDHTAFGW